MSCRKITNEKKISCKDCIYGWGKCGNIHGAYYEVPVYLHDTCPYAVAEVEGADDMRVTSKNTLFVPDVTRIGYQLRKIREQKGMTITQVAEKSKVSISFICQAEKGRRGTSIDCLLSWACALGYKNVVFMGE